MIYIYGFNYIYLYIKKLHFSGFVETNHGLDCDYAFPIDLCTKNNFIWFKIKRKMEKTI